MKICLTGRRAEEMRPQAEEILREAGTTGHIVLLKADGTFEGDPAGIEVVYFSMSVTESKPAMRTLMGLFDEKSLRWMQGPGAGIDNPIWQKILDRGVRLTNASGIHSEPIAQYIFTYILFWERNVARHLAQQTARHWEIIRSGDLAEKTLGIIGYGGIGQAAARIGKAFGMRVLGSRRSPVDDGVLDRFVPLSSLDELLEASHYVVLCMPFNDETQSMIGAAEFDAMRDDAVLINVARGGVVDETALISALEGKQIKGASLDVVSQEPLPEESPLWALENCVLTPHDAGYSPLGDERLGALFLENLGLFVRGQKMRNEVQSSGLSSD